jgi:SOS-response transcriptional repressor LexA
MNRIRQIRAEKGMNSTQLGKLVGTTHATISRLETGEMQLTQQWAERIAKALDVHLAEIFGDIVPARTTGLPVLGEVAAGVWREAELTDAPKDSPLPIGSDPAYPNVRQFALRVAGESMNRIVQDGAYIVCVSWADLGRPPRESDLVVVERRRDGLVETTVKRIRTIDQQVCLVPDSDNQRWQKPIPLGGGLDGDEIAIVALVVGKYERIS